MLRIDRADTKHDISEALGSSDKDHGEEEGQQEYLPAL